MGEQKSIDVLAVIGRHAESHRALAETDAYSAQEAPRLEAALAAVAELVEAAAAVVADLRADRAPDLIALADCIRAAGGKGALRAALARAQEAR